MSLAPRTTALLVTVLLLAIPASAAQSSAVTWDSLPTHRIQTFRGTLQGVALHNDTVIALATSDIAAYSRDGTLLAGRSTTGDGSYGKHLGDGVVVDGRIYISTSNYPVALHDRKAAISIHDADTLAYVGEWKPQGNLTGAGGGVGAKNGTLWWPFLHKDCSTCALEQTIYQVHPSNGTVLATYDLVNADGYYGYQTADWITDTLLLATNHGGRGRDYSDVYEWNGTGFAFVGTADHASWISLNLGKLVEYGSQGFAVERVGDHLFTWWAGRDSAGNGGGTGEIVRLTTRVHHPDRSLLP